MLSYSPCSAQCVSEQNCAKIPLWMKVSKEGKMNRIFYGSQAPTNIPWHVRLEIPQGFYIIGWYQLLVC